MPTCEFIDTFPAYLTYWDKVQHQSLEHQIEAWMSQYMSQWPELLEKQVEDYTAQGADWRQIAKRKVFPYLGARLFAMKKAHSNLLERCGPIYSIAQSKLGFESDVIFVIYVGIGCGAGWATLFRGSPAILFGLENIAECGWTDAEAIGGLVAHEFSHLVHYYWRQEYGKPMGSGPWWQLYEEGFAQYCESVILDTRVWHQIIENENWLEWCESHKGWLATEFLRYVDSGESVSPFFGSWLHLDGKSETGYFLGYKLIRKLQEALDLKDIALLDDVENHLRPLLERMAGFGG
ncbi:MAG: hypothetical protein KJ606_01185 [Chloroflexi bacterium]|nr:hypothetical protein [Chloroflexota bacterium]